MSEIGLETLKSRPPPGGKQNWTVYETTLFREVAAKLSENAHGLSSDHILAGEKNPPRGISISPTFGLDFIGYTCNQLVTSAVRTKRRAGVTERGGSDSAIRLWTGLVSYQQEI